MPRQAAQTGQGWKGGLTLSQRLGSQPDSLHQNMKSHRIGVGWSPFICELVQVPDDGRGGRRKKITMFIPLPPKSTQLQANTAMPTPGRGEDATYLLV